MSGQYELYRASYPDGSTRDCAIGHDPDGTPAVLVYTGKTGGSLRMERRNVSLPDNDGRTQHELIDASIKDEAEKLVANEFVYIGVATIVDRRVTSIASQGDGDVNDLHWEQQIKLSKNENVQLFDFLREALGNAPLPGSRVRFDDKGLLLESGRHTWRLGPEPSPDGVFNPSGNRGGGTIRSALGVLPALILASINRRHPGMIVASKNDGNQVSLRLRDVFTEYGVGDSTVIRNLAVRLDLCVPALSFETVKANGFWF